MNTEGKTPEKTSKKEQAINLEETHGKKINHQVKDKKEYTQPRDNLNANKE
ncbi:hypothetical protein JCM19294_1736 [Nonlabens tegetincola]|uniref:Uncharacterized protein n=1 Tax=Nonlabens tegetincola TaxID=323273 RepID=A0A090Q3A3_9FLAO|nr:MULTISPECIES: hypothetical protein [Nonlabens]MEE2800959.1 hypothetical protein [Bacteroidota bacterium]GAK96223.1 hypothetical protein JCM19294_1736 [Nonlabens tegetincola]